MTRSHPEQALPEKKRILIFCSFFRPSTKSGGGMWSVVNLVDRFSDTYEFVVVTRNHESPNDFVPFASVKSDSWNKSGGVRVYYVSPRKISVNAVASLVDEVRPDGVFLNSVFSSLCVKYLLGRRRGLVIQTPVILAPCGELAASALRSKGWKKLPFLFLARWFGLYERVVWKASSEIESEEIRGVIGRSIDSMVAPDLPPRQILPEYSIDRKPVKEPGSVKLVFLSRILPVKNLAYLLDQLMFITEGTVDLTIVGPHEDARYWDVCKRMIEVLPPNISVNVVGGVPYEEGLKLLTENHLFILPTLGENFGYVILEALAAGCSVIVSDRTIWGQVEERGAGAVLSLSSPEMWVNALNEVISMNQEEFGKVSRDARKFAVDWLSDSSIESATAKILEHAFGR